MKTFKLYIALLAVISFLMQACSKDDYRIGGDLHEPNINMTTYDYLKSNQYGLFDTLLLLVDRAGLKEKINQQGVTFFAPTDYAINRYVEARSLAIQRVDPFKRWTVDSILEYELDKFTDSLDIYFVNDSLPNTALIAEGQIYTNKTSNQVVVSYEETTDPNLGFNPNSSVLPKVVYYTYLYQTPANGSDLTEIAYPVGVRTRVQTSNALTTTGVLHVLNNSHTLFYYR